MAGLKTERGTAAIHCVLAKADWWTETVSDDHPRVYVQWSEGEN